MTQKELNYIEDAVGHEKNIIKILNDSKQNMKNENLINFIDNEINTHKSIYEKLMNMLEEKANG